MAFDTQTGTPNASGVIPAGATVTFTLWMKKTSDFGVMYPRAKVLLNGATGASFCTATGPTSLTTSLTRYMLTCATAADVAIASTDRLYLWAGLQLAVGPGANRLKGELDIEGVLEGDYDSQIVVPLPVPVISGLAPTSGAAGTTVTITGSGFGSVQGSSTISFNSISATASSWSDTVIVATVPAEATTGKVVVTGGGGPSNGVVFSVDLPEGVIVTLAGNGAWLPFGGDGGPAPAATLYNPTDVAADSLGNIYIADPGNERIRKVAPDGTIATVAGTGVYGYSGDGGPATSAQLWDPSCVAVDDQGNLFICDEGNGRIRKVSPDGTITPVAGSGLGFAGDGGPATNALLRFPRGTAITSVGGLFIADYGNERIRYVDPSGTIRTIAGTGVTGYNGDNRTAFSAYLSGPSGVAVDSEGNLYIADSGNCRIRKVSSGIITTVAGNGVSGFGGDGGPATDAQFNGPQDVTIDASGNIFIADYYNKRIRMVDRAGTITTVAGNGVYGFSGDGGPAVSAQMTFTAGVGLTPRREILIADWSNNRVRKVGGPPAPTISDLAPSLGPVGTMVTITGTTFGATQANGIVTFNGTVAAPATWSETSIVVPVPSGATKGPVEVRANGIPSNGIPFRVTPRIDSVSPTTGPAGTSVTIEGWNFIADNEASTLTFNGVTAVPTFFSATRLVAPVPQGATSGPIVMTVGGYPSNGVNFNVRPPPAITSLSPIAAVVGTSVTISGTDFGATQGSSTVTFNGTLAVPTSWSDTSLVVPVPQGATPGPVVVTVDTLPSNGADFTVLSLRITIPAQGETLNRPDTVVMGQVTYTGQEPLLVVNGRPVLVNGQEFAINGIDLALGPTVITATLTDPSGAVLTTSVTVQSDNRNAFVRTTTGVDISLAPMAPHLEPQPYLPAALTEVWVDIIGPGHISSTSIYPTPNVLPTLYSPGIYLATVTARTTESYTYVDRVTFSALDAQVTETLLRQKWDAMKTAVLGGDMDGAMAYFVTRLQERHRARFIERQSYLAEIFGSVSGMYLVSVTNEEAEAETLKTEAGRTYSYPIIFFWGEDGKWKIRDF